VEHEAVEELLAGYVLRSLSGEDAREADRLLSEHVPGCARCRDALAGYRDVASDLALEPSPIAAPDVLLPRLHRELEVPERRRRPAALFAAAASVVAVLGLGGLAVTQGMQASDARQRADLVRRVLDLSQQPDTRQVPVGPVTEFARPGVGELYLYGTGVPDPNPGMVYRFWLVSGSTYAFCADVRPDEGVLILACPVDSAKVYLVVVTEVPEGSAHTEPVDVTWSSEPTAAA
jgi:anti-sigma-K factor RskA